MDRRLRPWVSLPAVRMGVRVDMEVVDRRRWASTHRLMDRLRLGLMALGDPTLMHRLEGYRSRRRCIIGVVFGMRSFLLPALLYTFGSIFSHMTVF